jgi:hypothetical protein
MILDVDSEVTLTVTKRDPFWDGPARKSAVSLEPEVVVEPS